MKTQDELIDAILTVSIGFYGSMYYIGCLNIVYGLIYHIGCLDMVYGLICYTCYLDMVYGSICYTCYLDMVYGSICYTCYLDMVYGSICYTCYLDMVYVSICCIGCLDWTSLLQNIALALRKDFLRSFTWQGQKIFQKTDILDPLTRTHTYAYQG